MKESEHHALDAADRRILREVQTDMRRSPEDIATSAGMSVSTYRRKLKRLRESSVIQREVALVDTAASGIEIIVIVTMSEEHSAAYERLARKVLQSVAITQCYTVTGEADLILHAHMPDMQSFETWLRDTIISDPAVKRCTSHVVYSRVKFETALPF